MNESHSEPATPPVSPPPDPQQTTAITTEAQREEKKRDAKRGFIIHFIIYVLVIAGLVYLDYGRANETDKHWAQWPAMGWGIGVLFHGLGVFLGNRKK